MPINRNKPTFVKLNRVVPESRDRNIIVKVIRKTTLVDKINRQGVRTREQKVVVADDTGCMFLHARDELCDKLVDGSTVALRNAKAIMVQNRMWLGFDKWGSVETTTIAVPGEPKLDPDFSHHVYNLIDEDY